MIHMHETDFSHIIRHPNQDIQLIKGPVVNLSLIQFFKEQLVDGIPFYYFDILKGDQKVGKISLRLGFNDTTISNGHVGYEIDEAHQGYNYSYYALLMIKELALEHQFPYLIVTTTEDNIASMKMIEKAGGELMIQGYEVPKNHIFYVLGKPKMNIYKIGIKEDY